MINSLSESHDLMFYIVKDRWACDESAPEGSLCFKYVSWGSYFGGTKWSIKASGLH